MSKEMFDNVGWWSVYRVRLLKRFGPNYSWSESQIKLISLVTWTLECHAKSVTALGKAPGYPTHEERPPKPPVSPVDSSFPWRHPEHVWTVYELYMNCRVVPHAWCLWVVTCQAPYLWPQPTSKPPRSRTPWDDWEADATPTVLTVIASKGYPAVSEKLRKFGK